MAEPFVDLLNSFSEDVEAEVQDLKVSSARGLVDLQAKRKGGGVDEIIGITVGRSETQIALLGLCTLDFDNQSSRPPLPLGVVRAMITGGALLYRVGRRRHLLVGSADLAEIAENSIVERSFGAWSRTGPPSVESYDFTL